jgi:hypothetical protein
MPSYRLDFDDELHIYTVNGQAKTSVTQALEGAGIIDYSHIPPATRQMALERGRRVHLATQFDDEGDYEEGSFGELEGFVQAWRRFRREMRFDATLIEFRGYNPMGDYCGTLDREGTWRDGERVLIDIKTNQAEDWVRMQLAAYAAFRPDPRALLRVCVELHADGTYDARRIYTGADQQRHFGEFLACLTTFRLKQELRRNAA